MWDPETQTTKKPNLVLVLHKHDCKYVSICQNKSRIFEKEIERTLTPGAKAPSKTAWADDISPPADCFFSI